MASLTRPPCEVLVDSFRLAEERHPKSPSLPGPVKDGLTRFIRSSYRKQQPGLWLDHMRRRAGEMPCIRGGGCQPLSVRTDLNSAPLPRSRRGYQSQPFHLHPRLVHNCISSSASFASETPAGPKQGYLATTLSWRLPRLLMSMKQTPTPFSASNYSKKTNTLTASNQ